MWILSIEDLNSEDGVCSQLFFREKDEAMKRVTSIVNSAAAHHLTVEPAGDSNESLHIFSSDESDLTNQLISVCQAEHKFEVEPTIVSNTYFYRDSYFIECLHDSKLGIVAVYLYDRENPGDKYGIWRAKLNMYADDQDILTAVLPDIEPMIEEIETLNSGTDDLF